MKFILNTLIAKKASFGGFRVACNFLRATLCDNNIEWYYLLSQDVAEALSGEMPNDYYNCRTFVFSNQPNYRTYFQTKKKIKQIVKQIKPDLVYSIVAPSYFTFESPEVMRCANAWTVKGGINQYVLRVTPIKLILRRYLLARITQCQMRKTKYFVTQSQIAKKCILKTVRTDPDNVCVVSNVLSEQYKTMNIERIVHEGYNMVYASSPAFHKDFMILPQVASILVKQYGLKNFTIHCTLPQNSSMLPAFISALKKYHVEGFFVNHGLLKQNELATLYAQCDLGLFPSLLETFSATLLEYMQFNLPIVASDLDFNKVVTEDAAVYFKPHDANDFAEKIHMVYCDKTLVNDLQAKGNKRLSFFSNNADKYNETVKFLLLVADRKGSINN